MWTFSLIQSVFWHTDSAGRFSDGGASAQSSRSEINHPVEFRRCWWCWWRLMTLLSVKTERMRLIKLRRLGRDGGRGDSNNTEQTEGKCVLGGSHMLILCEHPHIRNWSSCCLRFEAFTTSLLALLILKSANCNSWTYFAQSKPEIRSTSSSFSITVDAIRPQIESPRGHDKRLRESFVPSAVTVLNNSLFK